MAHLGVDQIHLPGLALVLLEGGDPVRIRRPLHDRLIGVLPAGVVGGVAVILDPVGGQLGLGAGGQLAHPQVPVANERLGPLVRGQRAGLRIGLGVDLGAAGIGIADHLGVTHGEAVTAIGGQRDLAQAQLLGLDRLVACGQQGVQRSRQRLGVEQRRGPAGGHVGLQQAIAAGVVVGVDKVACIQPGHPGHGVVDQRLGEQQPVGPGIVGVGHGRGLRAKAGRQRGQDQGAKQARGSGCQVHVDPRRRRSRTSAFANGRSYRRRVPASPARGPARGCAAPGRTGLAPDDSRQRRHRRSAWRPASSGDAGAFAYCCMPALEPLDPATVTELYRFAMLLAPGRCSQAWRCQSACPAGHRWIGGHLSFSKPTGTGLKARRPLRIRAPICHPHSPGNRHPLAANNL